MDGLIGAGELALQKSEDALEKAAVVQRSGLSLVQQKTVVVRGGSYCMDDLKSQCWDQNGIVPQDSSYRPVSDQYPNLCRLNFYGFVAVGPH